MAAAYGIEMHVFDFMMDAARTHFINMTNTLKEEYKE
jgi:hypothetical protein